MNVRPKTKFRITIIASVFLIAIVLGAVLFYNSKLNQRHKVAKLRQDGLAAFAQQDYSKSLSTLSTYFTLSQARSDAEALYAYGKSRARVEEVGGKHIWEGIGVLKEYLGLQPPDTDAKRIDDAQHIVLDLYTQAAMSGEALPLAEIILARNPADVDAIKAKATALSRMGRLDEALVVAEKFNEAAPFDLTGHRLTLELMHRLNHPGAELVDHVAGLLEKYPDDARFILLQGYVFRMTGDEDSAKQSFLKATKNPPNDPEFVKWLAEQLDGVRMYREAQVLLEKSSTDTDNPEIKQLLVQRLWQNGDFEGVIKRLDQLNPKDARANTQLLALLAMSYYQADPAQPEKAREIVDGLASRSNDNSAIAWTSSIKARFKDGEPDAHQVIEVYKSALVRDPGNYIIRYMMGEAYARLGETELAIEYWRQVVDPSDSRAMHSWAVPRVRTSQIWASQGRTQDALEEAGRGWASSPSPFAAGNYAICMYRAMEEKGDFSRIEILNNLLDSIHKQAPGEPQTLALYVTVLVRTGKEYTAREEIKKALDPARKPVPSLDTLLRLSSAARNPKINMSDDVLAYAEKVYGATPELASTRALDLFNSKKSEEGLNYLLKAAAGKSSDMAWQLAIARYRELIKDPAAVKDWMAIGDAYPQQIVAQNAVLDSRVSWDDRELISRTIERVKTLTGEEGIGWKLSKARWLLLGTPGARESAEAISLLNEIVAAGPNLVRPRLILAKAMESVNDRAGAIEQLRRAAALNPRSVEIAVELAAMLQGEGRSDEARAQIDRIAGSDSLTTEQRTRVAAFMLQLGDPQGAFKLLNSVPSTEPDMLRDGLMAEIHRRLGHTEAAEKLYTALLDLPNLDPAIAAAAAEFFGSLRKMDLANRAMEKLNAAAMDPGTREILRGNFEEHFGNPERAVEEYQKATVAAPKLADAWLRLAGFHLRKNHWDEAASFAGQGLAQLPNNADLLALKEDAELLKANSKSAIQPLADVLSQQPRNDGALETLRAIDAARTSNDPAKLILDLRAIADKYPQFLPVQNYVILGYVTMGQPNEAAPFAARAMNSFPSLADPARQATFVYMRAGQWREMLEAARKWRERAPGDPENPDTAIAEASLHMGDSQTALRTLEPYLAPAKADPEKHAPMLSAYAQALIQAGRSDDAVALLGPLAKGSPKWRAIWLSVGDGIRDAKSTKAWIGGVIPAMSLNSNDDQEALATAWHAYALKFNEREGFDKAKEILDPLSRRSDVNASSLMLYASTCEQLGDILGAEQAYRKCLEHDPNYSAALNNLAYILLTQNKNLDEAEKFATHAIELQPSIAKIYDTLARIQAKKGQRDAALRSFQTAIQLDPEYVEAMVGMADAYFRSGDREKGLSTLNTIEGKIAGRTNLPADLQQELQDVRELAAKS